MKKPSPLPSDAPSWKREIADAIKFQRTSMKEVSLALGYNETFVRDILKRQHEPGASKLERLQTHLGINNKPSGGYSKQALVNVARRLSQAGVLPPIDDDGETVVQAFIQICDEESKKLTAQPDPTTLLKLQPAKG